MIPPHQSNVKAGTAAQTSRLIGNQIAGNELDLKKPRQGPGGAWCFPERRDTRSVVQGYLPQTIRRYLPQVKQPRSLDENPLSIAPQLCDLFLTS
jgi:hypothetical protein